MRTTVISLRRCRDIRLRDRVEPHAIARRCFAHGNKQLLLMLILDNAELERTIQLLKLPERAFRAQEI